ncbi:MAG TPA: efflux RND transporter periplasmic adaptor subunit [Pyrinomonadaceae bacterium]|nr:efflux RND transporter periplasmic adaptor subunit [Pyrinomonadaceae bacterium]
MSEKKEIEMKEEIINEKSHHEQDEAELNRLEANLENGDGETVETERSESKPKNMFAWIITAGIIALVAIIGVAWMATRKSATSVNVETSGKKEEPGHSENEEGREVKLDTEALNSAGIQTEGVTQRPAVSKLYVTGTVEMNPEKTEMATPLVGGRIENVYYGVGDYVNQGDVLATISSPQLAQMHGKMHEARTRYELAQRNLERVLKSENRVGVLQAKARLDEAEANLKRSKIQADSAVSQAKAKLNEAEATLNRIRRLVELGAGAGKDLIAAQTAYRIEQENLQTVMASKDVVTAEATYKNAKAEYDFQNNISLNKEIQEAKAEVETSFVDLRHIQDEMRSLGVTVNINEPDDHDKDTSLVAIRSPLSGVITERKFNAGAGIEAAVPIFAISNLSTVYVIANAPEATLSKLSVGSIAEIKSTAVGTLNGRISYIDPRLDETTRTGRVRLEVPNQNGKLKAGMFTEVGFYAGTSESTGEELAVNSQAIQRDGDKTIVFVPKKDEPGAFEIREIEIGGELDGYTSVKSGLELGESVVTKGSFTLKTQMQKGELGDHDH